MFTDLFFLFWLLLCNLMKFYENAKRKTESYIIHSFSEMFCSLPSASTDSQFSKLLIPLLKLHIILLYRRCRNWTISKTKFIF